MLSIYKFYKIKKKGGGGCNGYLCNTFDVFFRALLERPEKLRLDEAKCYSKFSVGFMKNLFSDHILSGVRLSAHMLI